MFRPQILVVYIIDFAHRVRNKLTASRLPCFLRVSNQLCSRHLSRSHRFQPSHNTTIGRASNLFSCIVPSESRFSTIARELSSSWEVCGLAKVWERLKRVCHCLQAIPCNRLCFWQRDRSLTGPSVTLLMAVSSCFPERL